MKSFFEKKNKQAQCAVTYDTRIRHKLNMLEPGSKMLAAAVLLFGLGLLCSVFSCFMWMWVLFLCAALVVLVLLVLVAIELRQDRILNQMAIDKLNCPHNQEDRHL